MAPLVPALPFLTGSTMGLSGSDTGMAAALSQSSTVASAFSSDTLSAFIAEGKPLPGGQNQTLQSLNCQIKSKCNVFNLTL